MNRLVCDTNVIISGFLWNGKPRDILKRIEAKIDVLFISRDLLNELEKVLAYPKILKVMQRSSVSSRDLLEWVIRNSSIVIPKPLKHVIIEDDPDDDIVLACAATAYADIIISGDRHILQIIKYNNIPILTVHNYLKGTKITKHEESLLTK